MAKQIEWKAEVSFKGNEKEFDSFLGAINKRNVSVKMKKWPIPYPFPGYPAFKYIRRIPEETLANILEGSHVLKSKYINDIYGGLRTPHIHIGDKIHLLNPEKFSRYMGELGRVMAASIAEESPDHVEAMGRLSRLDDNVQRIMDEEIFSEQEIG